MVHRESFPNGLTELSEACAPTAGLRHLVEPESVGYTGALHQTIPNGSIASTASRAAGGRGAS